MPVRRAIIFLVFAVLLPGSIGLWLAGSWIHEILALVWLFLVALPVVTMLVENMLSRQRRNSDEKRVFAWVASGIVVAVISFWTAGKGLHSYRMREVRTFVETTLPLLDQYKARTGRYPAALRDVTNRPIPKYLPKDGGYSSDGASFTFYFLSPEDSISGRMLTDTHRVWARAD
jgi:hypothetical protein